MRTKILQLIFEEKQTTFAQCCKTSFDLTGCQFWGTGLMGITGIRRCWSEGVKEVVCWHQMRHASLRGVGLRICTCLIHPQGDGLQSILELQIQGCSGLQDVRAGLCLVLSADPKGLASAHRHPGGHHAQTPVVDFSSALHQD